MGTVGYLLDTHTFLWAVQEEGSRISENVCNARVSLSVIRSMTDKLTLAVQL